MYTDLTKRFPRLLDKGYRRTSPCTMDYNCLAWAMGFTSHWWEPDSFGLTYWPQGVSRNYSLKSYVAVCSKHGYRQCQDGSFEQGYEKVAIYTENNEFKHIARQLPNGQWTSKLGALDDITHDLDAFDGSDYGKPTVFLRRKIKP